MDKMCEFCIHAKWRDDDGNYIVEDCELGCNPVKEGQVTNCEGYQEAEE